MYFSIADYIKTLMDSMRQKERVKGQKKKIKEKDVWGKKKNGLIVRAQEKELGSNDYSSWSVFLFVFLFQSEEITKNSLSRWGFNTLSKIDLCIQRRKVERSWDACRVSAFQPPLCNVLTQQLRIPPALFPIQLWAFKDIPNLLAEEIFVQCQKVFFHKCVLGS